MKHTAVVVGGIGVHCAECLSAFDFLMDRDVDVAHIGIYGKVSAVAHNHYGVVSFGFEHG